MDHRCVAIGFFLSKSNHRLIVDLLADCRKGRARLPKLGVLYVNEFVCHGRENEALSNEGVPYYANKKLRFAQTPAGTGR